MKAGVIRTEMPHLIEHPGVGVRASAIELLSYDLTVLATDTADIVAGAGGWLFDRVRAGWKVGALIGASSDARPLDILGVRTHPVDSDAAEPAALALPARLLSSDHGLRRRVVEALNGGAAEVTMWGDAVGTDIGFRVARTQYRLSPAARAFKRQALMAAGLPGTVAPVEQFHSCALWYPADGPDLTSLR